MSDREKECAAALEEMLESLELATGPVSPLGEHAKGVVRGFFFGTKEQAEAALAARAEELSR